MDLYKVRPWTRPLGPWCYVLARDFGIALISSSCILDHSVRDSFYFMYLLWCAALSRVSRVHVAPPPTPSFGLEPPGTIINLSLQNSDGMDSTILR